MNEELFKEVLEEDEVINKIYKPCKKKMIGTNLLGTLCYALFLGIMLALIFLSVYNEDTASKPAYFSWLGYVIGGGTVVVIVLISVICKNAEYKKTVYAITNKRVLMKTGVIGVDYRTLDMMMIGAIDVDVSFSDKLFNSNTGTLSFGSSSLPMTNEKGQKSIYRFKDIKDPYSVYKEVKKAIDDCKTKK